MAGQVDVRRAGDQERPVAALLDAVAGAAAAAHARQLLLPTTNDNLRALGFYQRRGFRLVELLVGGVDRARKRKPSIPLLGSSGIPIRDELVLVRDLDPRDAL